MSRARSPVHKWRTAPQPCCAGAPGQRRSEPRGGAFPSYRAWGYKPAECPARDTLGGGWIGASALSILQSSPSPPRLAIHPGGGALWNLGQILLHPFARDVMGQRGKAEIWLTPSFRCYLFKFRFHGQLIFSLHRRPCLPLDGAHVAQEQFNYR